MLRQDNDLANLVIDTTTPLVRPGEERIRAWASAKRVFVSSTMDDLQAERGAAAGAITEVGAEPVLFETLGARSDDSRQAYTSEVRRSQIYLGILSKRYGSRLPSGYSATEEEYEEARRHRKEILIFLDANVPDREREGHLNRWIRDLYQFHVVGKYASIEDLKAKVLGSLVGLATHELTPWVKLDQLVFQASHIEKRRSETGTDIRMATPSRDPRITAQLSAWVDQSFGRGTHRLTVLRDSFEVSLTETTETVDVAGNDVLEFRFKRTSDPYRQSGTRSWWTQLDTYQTSSGEYTQRDLVEIALRAIALGAVPPDDLHLGELPRLDFRRLRALCDDARLFPHLVRLFIVETIHIEGIAEQVIEVDVSPVRNGQVVARVSVLPHNQYTNVQPEPIIVEGTVQVA